jgi:hypothetical protein
MGHDSKSNLRVSCTKRIKIGEERRWSTERRGMTWKCDLEISWAIVKAKVENVQ